MKNRTVSRAAGCLLLVLAMLPIGTRAHAKGPQAPTNLNVQITFDENPGPNYGKYSLVLSWTGSEGADGYTVYVKKLGENGGDFQQFTRSNGTSVTISDGIEICCAAYSYYVTANSGDRESDRSNTVSSVCGRDFNDGDFSDYMTSGVTEIVSDPPQRAQIGQEYRYKPAVGSILSGRPTKAEFTLLRAPSGMTIDPATGMISWMPGESGTYNVAFMVSDELNKEFDQQVWSIEVQGSSIAGVPVAGGITSSLYPNPATSHMTLRLSASTSPTEIRVTNLRGEELGASTAPAGDESTISLDLGSYAAGSYFLRIKNATEEKTIPFSVVR